MDQSKQKQIVFLVSGITVFVIAGLIIFFTVNPFGLPFRKNTSDEDSLSARSSVYDTHTLPNDTGPLQLQTIVIENVQDNKQLAEVLDILEAYSIENNIKDLKINCIKQEDTDSLKKASDTARQ